MPYTQEFQDILEGIDEEQLLAEIGEEELARQADMFDMLQKKEATVEDGQLIRGPPPATPHPSQPPNTLHSHTPRTPRTPYRKHSSSTLTEGGLSKFFEPGSEERRVATAAEAAEAGEAGEAGEHRAEEEQESEDEEPFDCSAEVVPYDVDGELVAVWNELQARVEREIETFTQTFITDAFKLVLELSSAMQRLHAETREQLEDLVSNIREEEGRHAHGVALMNDYYSKMESMLEVMRHPIRKT